SHRKTAWCADMRHFVHRSGQPPPASVHDRLSGKPARSCDFSAGSPGPRPARWQAAAPERRRRSGGAGRGRAAGRAAMALIYLSADIQMLT
ncbi:MAG: hypothetical protein LUP01_01240, partial [Methanothrix sp.]|nr:hypothetical protein [Methanothrix sp.]